MNRFYKNNHTRINIIITLIISIWSVIFIKLYFLQIINHKEANKKLINNIASYVTLKGDRGIIYDKNSIPLSQNVNKYTLWVDPIYLDTAKFASKNSIALKLSQIFNQEANHYLNKMSKKTHYVSLEKNVKEEYITNLKKLDGLNIDKSISRYYPFSELGSQVIGYTDNNNKGKIGIEAKFDHLLSGNKLNKYKTKKDQIYYSSEINSNKKPKKGADITLTIDIDFQTILQDELNMSLKNTGARTANGVIIDPYSGDIIAMSSIPSIDLNNYNHYPLEYQKNKVITDIYEPGSTYKIVTMAGKLELINIFDKQEYFCENGKYLYYDKTFNDHEGHNTLNLAEILAHSSNIGMVKIADEIGKQNVYKYSRAFGFGSSTGVPLIGESFGILKPLNKWSGISAPEISIGQEIAINNLQLAMAYCAIANGGYLLKPNIIDKIHFNDNSYYYEETKVIRKLISNDTSNQILSMLQDVIVSGTGNFANIKGFNIAGKTGTAQKVVDGEYSKESFVSSFAAIFPSNEPRYVCIISIDSADYSKGYHWSGISVAPIIKNIFERIIHLETYNKEFRSTEFIANYKNSRSQNIN